MEESFHDVLIARFSIDLSEISLFDIVCIKKDR